MKNCFLIMLKKKKKFHTLIHKDNMAMIIAKTKP